MGSSPISSAVVLSLAMPNPTVFLLYPLLSVAISYLSFSSRTRYSTMGVFPVPPKARLPTHIRGKLKAADLKYSLSKSQLRSQTIAPYKIETGRNKYLKLFSNWYGYDDM